MKCKSCGKSWTEHRGLEPTCKRLQSALGALKVICTWATFRKGEALVPAHVEKLCKKVLEENK